MCGRAYEPALPVDLAQRAHRGDGRRAGRQRAGHRRRDKHRGAGALERRRRGPGLQGADPRRSTSAQGHPYYATARLWDDGIIDPATRAHGAAVGGGVGMMLACDFAIAASAARFGLTSARNGLLAGIAIPVLIEAVGPRVARQLLMHGGTFDAPTALRIGLVDQVVEADALDTTVAALARELQLAAPSVQTMIKKLVTQINALPHDTDAADILGEHVANQCVSEEALEGMSAFLDKRKPKWVA
jgi:hypothetical protein